MIKAEVNVIGRITRNAVIRTDKNSNPYVAFAMAINLPDAKNVTTEVPVFVSIPNGKQEDLNTYVENVRVAVSGTMDVRKKDDALVFYLTANLLSTECVADLDAITGELSFRGHLRSDKIFEEKTDKNGNPFLVFSAYSAEKIGRTSSAHGSTSVASQRRMQVSIPSSPIGCFPKLTLAFGVTFN